MIQSLMSSRGLDGKGLMCTSPLVQAWGQGAPCGGRLDFLSCSDSSTGPPDLGQPRCFVSARHYSPGHGGPGSVPLVHIFTDPVDAEKQRFFPIPEGPPSCPLAEAPHPALCRRPAAPGPLRSAPGPGALPSPQRTQGEVQESRGTGPRPCSLRLHPRGRGPDPLLLPLGSVTAWEHPGPGI